MIRLFAIRMLAQAGRGGPTFLCEEMPKVFQGLAGFTMKWATIALFVCLSGKTARASDNVECRPLVRLAISFARQWILRCNGRVELGDLAIRLTIFFDLAEP